MATRCILHRVQGQRKFISGKFPMTKDEDCILCGIHRSRHGSHDIFITKTHHTDTS